MADIVQISDRTLSTGWLLDPVEGPHRRAAVLEIVRREVAKACGQGVLVVATKAVLRSLHADLGHPVGSTDDDALRRPLVGAIPRWFGPRMQGVNDYEAFATVVIVGRLQPQIVDVETSARAVFCRDGTPIAALQGPLPAVPSHRLMADRTRPEAVTRAHPDPRVQAMLAQTRECGTLQAIARLRLAAPEQAKRVVILSALPLPDFPIGRLVPFDAMARGLEMEPDQRGFLRMETAMRAMTVDGVRGVRLSHAGLAADLSMEFSTTAAAKAFRRGRSTDQLIALCRRIADANGWPVTALRLRRQGGGKAVSAIVLAPTDLAMNHARLLWLGLACEPH